MNKAILYGRLGADPKFNKTNTKGISVCNFSLATNEKWYDRDAAGNVVVDPATGKAKLNEKTEWHNVVCWGKLAERVSQFMRKGMKVMVEGKIQTREFAGTGKYAANRQNVVDANNNIIPILRYTTEIIADIVEFPDKAGQSTAYPAATQAVAPQAVVAAAPPVQAGQAFVMNGQQVGTTTYVAPPNVPTMASAPAVSIPPAAATIPQGV
jgi:single-strand DNA-binding protein